MGPTVYKPSHLVLLPFVNNHAVRAAGLACCSLLLWCMSYQDWRAGSCCRVYFQAGHLLASLPRSCTRPDHRPRQSDEMSWRVSLPPWPTYGLQQGDHGDAQAHGYFWRCGPTCFVHPLGGEGRSCCRRMALLLGARTKPEVCVCSWGNPKWFLALEGMAAAHVGQRLASATCVATSSYSQNVAMYTPSLCLHITNIMSLESDLTCFQNTFSPPESALIWAVHPFPGLGPGTRNVSEVPEPVLPGQKNLVAASHISPQRCS